MRDGTGSYFAQRADEERQCAARAASEPAKAIHNQLAARYDRLARSAETMNDGVPLMTPPQDGSSNSAGMEHI